jgi:hypothetical protein
MKEKHQEAIDEIMDWFDFERVVKVMEFLNWKWITAEEGVPSIGEIKKTARRLLKEAIKKKTSIATGGFKVTYLPKEDFLHLEFVISEFDVVIKK